MENKFEELKRELFKFLGEAKIMVLATCSNNRVTARNMSCIIFDEKLYIQTDKNFLKYEQIVDNPNVALCVDNYQIECIAEIKGDPSEKENKDFVRLFEKNYKSSYDAYSKAKDEVVIEFKPTFVEIWKYEGKQAVREYIDFNEKNSWRSLYNPS